MIHNFSTQLVQELKTKFYMRCLGFQVWHLARKMRSSNPDIDQALLGCLWSMAKIKQASHDTRIQQIIEEACEDVHSMYRDARGHRNLTSLRKVGQ